MSEEEGHPTGIAAAPQEEQEEDTAMMSSEQLNSQAFLADIESRYVQLQQEKADLEEAAAAKDSTIQQLRASQQELQQNLMAKESELANAQRESLMQKEQRETVQAENQTKQERMDRMQAEADTMETVLKGAGIGFSAIDHLYELDMLYLGQTHTVAVPLEIGAGGLDRETIQAAFEAAYRTAYGRLLDNIPMRVMNYRIAVIGRRPGLDMALFAPADGKAPEACRTETRSVYADGKRWDTPVHDRLALATGSTIDGPALLEQADTTIFVDPGLTGTVDPFGNLIIRPKD